MSAFYFLVTFPEAGTSMTWIGGGLKPSRTAGRVWLTKPGGEPVIEVALANVKPTTREETAKRIQADLLAAKAPLN